MFGNVATFHLELRVEATFQLKKYYCIAFIEKGGTRSKHCCFLGPDLVLHKCDSASDITSITGMGEGRAIKAKAVSFEKPKSGRQKAKLVGASVRAGAMPAPALKSDTGRQKGKKSPSKGAPKSTNEKLAGAAIPEAESIVEESKPESAVSFADAEAAGRDACLKMLTGGYVQSFVDLFHFTRQGKEAGNQTEKLLGKNLEFVNEKLISAEMSRRVGKTDNVYASYTDLAHFFQGADDVAKSLRFYERGLETASMSKDRDLEAKANHNLGAAHLKLNHVDEAIKFHERELAMSEELEDSCQIQLAASQLAKGYEKKADELHASGDAAVALEYREKCLAAAQRTGNKAAEGGAHYRLGQACASLKMYEKAAFSIHEHISICKALKDVKGEGDGCAVLAAVFQEQGQNDEAVGYLDRFLKIAQENDDLSAQAEACRTLGATHNSLGQFSKAAENFQRYYDLSRSILANNSEKEAQKHLDKAKVLLGMARGNERMGTHVFTILNDASALLKWKGSP